MDDKNKKAIGIGLGALALLGLGIGLSKMKKSPPHSNTCSDPNQYWNGVECVDKPIIPDDPLVCETGYHPNADNTACVADIVEDWLSKMPALPSATYRGEHLWQRGAPAAMPPTGEHYLGLLPAACDVPGGIVWDVEGWIPGFASANPSLGNTWVKALAPSTVRAKHTVPLGPYQMPGIDPADWPYQPFVENGLYLECPFWTQFNHYDYNYRHLSIAELGNNYTISGLGTLPQILAWLRTLIGTTRGQFVFTQESYESYKEWFEAGCYNPYTFSGWTNETNDSNSFSYKKDLPYFILDRNYFGGGWPAGCGGYEEGDGLGLALKDGPLQASTVERFTTSDRAEYWLSQATMRSNGKAVHPFAPGFTYSGGEADYSYWPDDKLFSVGDIWALYNSYQGGLYVWEFVEENPLYRLYLATGGKADITGFELGTPPNKFWRCVAIGPYYDPAY